MKLSTLFNSKFGTGTALWLGRTLPVWLGYPFSRVVADWLSSQRDFSQVRALRSNLWVASGESASSQQLDAWVKQNFRNSARAIFDFYHNIRSPQRVIDLVEIAPSFQEIIEIGKTGKQGQILVLPHVSNFDLVGRAAALRGLQMQVISAPNPPGGYAWQNVIREEVGIEITPASPEAMRRAMSNLRRGSTVLTGVDRPFAASSYHPVFFGRPAALPVVHVQLALRMKLPIKVICGALQENHRYLVWASQPVMMKEMLDHDAEILRNSEAVLEVAEALIRQYPEQWNMTHPIWPEMLEETP